MEVLTALDDDKGRRKTLSATAMAVGRPYIVEAMYQRKSGYSDKILCAVADVKRGRGNNLQLNRIYLPMRYNTAEVHKFLPLAFPLNDLQLTCERVLKLPTGHETALLRFKRVDVRNPDPHKSYQVLLRALASAAGMARAAGEGGSGSGEMSRKRRIGGGAGGPPPPPPSSPPLHKHRKVDRHGEIINSDRDNSDDDDDDGDDGAGSSRASVASVEDNHHHNFDDRSDGDERRRQQQQPTSTDMLLVQAAEQVEKLQNKRRSAARGK